MRHEMYINNKKFLSLCFQTSPVRIFIEDIRGYNIRVGDEVIFIHADDGEKRVYTTVFSNVTSEGDLQEKEGVLLEVQVSHEWNHGYIYTVENSNPRFWAEHFNDEVRNRNYLIYGPSGCGKTTYVHSICHGQTVSEYTREQIHDMIINQIKYNIPIPSPQHDIVIIDFGDKMGWLFATEENLLDLINNWSKKANGEKRTIILMLSSLFLKKFIGKHFHPIFIEEIQMTPYVIRTVAENIGVEFEITEAELQELCGARMSEAIGGINKNICKNSLCQSK